jgi:CheY-like chemotaxis protein
MNGHQRNDVLVVEDDEEIREILVEVLEEHGYLASGAANGLEALARLRGGLRPRLILLDVLMPVMDAAAFRTEQQRDPFLAGIPVVLVSASRRAIAGVDRTGLKDVLEKPFDVHRILRVLAEECAVAAELPAP